MTKYISLRIKEEDPKAKQFFIVRGELSEAVGDLHWIPRSSPVISKQSEHENQTLRTRESSTEGGDDKDVESDRVVPSNSEVDQQHFRNTYNPDAWRIVPQPTFANGKLCDGFHPEDHSKFKLVDWPVIEAHKPLPDFANLPGELKNRIWELSLPEPRIIGISFIKDSGALAEGTPFAIDKYANEHPSAQHMFTCRDSRGIFLSHYRPFQYLALLKEKWTRVRGRKPIYIDGTKDTVLFLQLRFSEELKYLNVYGLQNIGIQLLPRFLVADEWFRGTINLFPDVKNVSYVLNYSHYPEDDRSNGVNPCKGAPHRRHLVCIKSKFVHTPRLARYPKYWEYRTGYDGIFYSWKFKTGAMHRRFKRAKRANGKKWKGIKFTCSLLGTESCQEWWQSEVLHLVPETGDQQNAEIAYYTLRPVARCVQESRVLMFEDCGLRWNNHDPKQDHNFIIEERSVGSEPEYDLAGLFEENPSQPAEQNQNDAEMDGREMVLTSRHHGEKQMGQYLYIPRQEIPEVQPPLGPIPFCINDPDADHY